MQNDIDETITANSIASESFSQIAKNLVKTEKIRLIDIAKIQKDLRQWGKTWEIGFILSFIENVVADPGNVDKTLEAYNVIYHEIYTNNIQQCYDLKTLLDVNLKDIC
jgi:hypothetical protein